MFKDDFKYYKSKKPPPDLKGVLNFNESRTINSDKVKKIKIITKEPFFGVLPADEWCVYELNQQPGLIFIKNPFNKIGERYWIVRCLKDYTRKPNVLNIDAHNLVGEGIHWWDFAQTNESVKKKLRWATLGYHHDWDSKVYTEEAKNEFPADLNQLCTYFANALNFVNFNAEAAIVNFYHMDSTLSGHTDHSEHNLEAPLFSLSFGQSAIFLLGGETIDVKPSAILLQSGDLVIMSKAARLSYHGVPKILPSKTSTWETNQIIGEPLFGDSFDKEIILNCLDDTFWGLYKKYVEVSRINVNVRQVLKRGQKRLNDQL